MTRVKAKYIYYKHCMKMFFMDWLLKLFLKLICHICCCSLPVSKRYVFASLLFQEKKSVSSKYKLRIQNFHKTCQRLCSRKEGQRSSRCKRWKSSLVYSCFACSQSANRKFRLHWEQGHRMGNRRWKNMLVVWWNDPPLVLHAGLTHHKSSWKLSIATVD